ncbi:MAG: hypothetical protein O2794_02190 [bacterium]|nr:hypothetical protein [bacterium]
MNRINYKTTSSRALSDDKIFRTEAGTELSLFSVVSEIKKYVAKYPNAKYEVVIGSDSHAVLKGTTNFVTAVVVRRIGNGGIHFWTKHRERTFNFKERIWREAMLSVTLAQEFRSLIKDELGEEMFWGDKIEFKCIHLDVGEGGQTKTLLDGICGMVKGFGFSPVIKPYSYGAFVVADKHT